MKRYEITVNGRAFDVRVLSDPLQDQVEVEVDGEVILVKIQAPSTGEAPAVATPTEPGTSDPPTASISSPKVAAPAGNTVTAPLPGVIKSIAVRPGQQASIGDELLVIEAMKMDNVIRAAREGVVETIYVTEGHQIAHGETLLEYRP